MAKWELIAEVKDTGYYIGWKRAHKFIHVPEPIEPMGKTSLVQLGGRKGNYLNHYEVRGLTYAHFIFEPHKAGLKLFDEVYFCQTIEEARVKATELKKKIARLFDEITRSDETGNLT